jgi:hypothetical protein
MFKHHKSLTRESIRDPSQLYILLHNLLDIGDRYMAAVWQRQAVLSECSHRVDNVCQLILLITIKVIRAGGVG